MNTLDKAIAYINPKRGRDRAVARAQMDLVSTFITGGASQPAYNAGSMVRKGLRRWLPGLFKHPDEEVLGGERDDIIARSRDAYRNQPIARGAVGTMLINTIGAGLVMHSRIDREFLGISDKEAKRWQENVERLFSAWGSGSDSDAGRRHTFARLQHIAYKAYKVSGEVFALLPIIPRSGTICSLRVQLIETDRVSTPIGVIDGVKVYDGIEVGNFGEPIAYHIETTPIAPFMGGVNLEWKRVLAYGPASGRRQVIHFYDEDRPNQRRGMPSLTPILECLKSISDYAEAELRAAVIAACFAVFVKRGADGSDPTAGIAGAPSPLRPTEPEKSTAFIEPGAIVGLEEGESIDVANPARPNAAFDPFVSSIMQQIAIGLNIPYEVLTKRFQASYSASRAAIMQAWEFFKIERSWWVNEFLQPIYEEWLSQMIVSGAIKAPGFFDSVEIQRAYSRADWYGPVPLQIDPGREANAASARMSNRTSTLAEESAMRGGDWRQNLMQLREEQEEMLRLGLIQIPYGDPPHDNPLQPEP